MSKFFSSDSTINTYKTPLHVYELQLEGDGTLLMSGHFYTELKILLIASKALHSQAPLGVKEKPPSFIIFQSEAVRGSH